MLKDFIQDSMNRITKNILTPSPNNLVLKNTVTFFEKTSNMPLVYEDGQLIIEHYEKLSNP